MSVRKVLLVSPVAFFKGGAERSLFDLIRNPAIAPVLAVPGEGEIADEARRLGVPVELFDLGSVASIRRPFRFSSVLSVLSDFRSAISRIRVIAKRHEAAVIHSNGLKAHAVGVVAGRVAGIPTIAHIRDIPHTKQEYAVWHLLGLLASRIVVVSSPCWPMKAIRNNVAVVHNGTTLADAPPAPDVAKGLRLGIVGRIHPDKGLHVLLDWIAGARAKGLDVSLCVRGSFAPETPDYEALVQERVRALDLSQHVQIEGFVQDPSQVYAGIDIVCAPAVAPEPLGRSVMEGMAHGLPVLATPTGGSVDMIIDGEAGFFVRNGREFIDVLTGLAGDPSLIRSNGQASRARVAAHFSLEALHRNMTRQYDLAASGRAGA